MVKGNAHFVFGSEENEDNYFTTSPRIDEAYGFVFREDYTWAESIHPAVAKMLDRIFARVIDETVSNSRQYAWWILE